MKPVEPFGSAGFIRFPARIRREPRPAALAADAGQPDLMGGLTNPVSRRMADPEAPEGGWRAPNPSGAANLVSDEPTQGV